MWEPTQWVGQDGQALYAFLGGWKKIGELSPVDR